MAENPSGSQLSPQEAAVIDQCGDKLNTLRDSPSYNDPEKATIIDSSIAMIGYQFLSPADRKKAPMNSFAGGWLINDVCKDLGVVWEREDEKMHEIRQLMERPRFGPTKRNRHE